MWRGVAEVLARGVHSLHPTARWAMLVGALVAAGALAALAGTSASAT